MIQLGWYLTFFISLPILVLLYLLIKEREEV